MDVRNVWKDWSVGKLFVVIKGLIAMNMCDVDNSSIMMQRYANVSRCSLDIPPSANFSNIHSVNAKFNVVFTHRRRRLATLEVHLDPGVARVRRNVGRNWNITVERETLS
jgi:hypothetical protein